MTSHLRHQPPLQSKQTNISWPFKDTVCPQNPSCNNVLKCFREVEHFECVLMASKTAWNSLVSSTQ